MIKIILLLKEHKTKITIEKTYYYTKTVFNMHKQWNHKIGNFPANLRYPFNIITEEIYDPQNN